LAKRAIDKLNNEERNSGSFIQGGEQVLLLAMA